MTLALARDLPQIDVLQLVRLWQRGALGGGPQQQLRFHADLDAGYPGRAITAVAQDRHALRIHTADFCVGSALGPLPEPYLQWVREQERDGRMAMRDFLDLFNHRMNLLRYEMRAAFEPGLCNGAPQDSALAAMLGAVMGVMDAPPKAAMPVPARSWLGMGSLHAGPRRSGAAVQQVLAAHLDCKVSVQPMIGVWRRIEPEDRQCLGTRRLGTDALLGASMWDRQARVQVGLGTAPATPQATPPSTRPSTTQATLHFERLQTLLPPPAQAHTPAGPALPGAHHDALAGLLRLMLDRRHDAQVDVAVDATTVPPSRLAAGAGAPTAATAAAPSHAGLRLGQTAWLKSSTGARPASPAPISRFIVRAFEPRARS